MVKQQVRWLVWAVLIAAWGGGLVSFSPAVAQTDSEWRCVEVTGHLPLSLHSAPGSGAAVVAFLEPGQQVQADYTRLQAAGDFNWVPVRGAGQEGWAITPLLRPCASEYPSPAHDVVLANLDEDGVLDRYEIAEVSRAVVLVANIQRDRIVLTGTGTITTPDGLVVTNAHVVEGADRIGIALLDDINDPPELRYYGAVVRRDDEIDVALVAIRSDVDGRPVDPAALNLPYIPASLQSDAVFRGDPVYIFGYPDIGDDYLVVTTGSIVSVENGDVGMDRMPVWYRTDAEIAPGNSGGLVVGGNGEFIGIPTFVRSESETGGRLGGIRPAGVALMAVLDEATQPVPVDRIAVPEAPSRVQLVESSVEVDAVEGGQTGLRLRASFVLTGWAKRDALLVARFYYNTLTVDPLINAAASPAYRDANNAVLTFAPLLPCCEETYFEDMALFIPYDALGITQSGVYRLRARVEIAAPDLSWTVPLTWEFLTYERP